MCALGAVANSDILLIEMAVSTNRGIPFMGVLIIRVLLFGVYIGAPDLWKLPNLEILAFETSGLA